jgi:hypothetical protein
MVNSVEKISRLAAEMFERADFLNAARLTSLCLEQEFENFGVHILLCTSLLAVGQIDLAARQLAVVYDLGGLTPEAETELNALGQDLVEWKNINHEAFNHIHPGGREKERYLKKDSFDTPEDEIELQLATTQNQLRRIAGVCGNRRDA